METYTVVALLIGWLGGVLFTNLLWILINLKELKDVKRGKHE